MNNTSKNYKELLKAFGEEKFSERFQFLISKGKKSIKNLEKNHQTLDGTFHLSNSIVEDLVLDYLTDISRLKEFHNIEKTQPQKVAAHTSFWIQRKKPIQLLKDPDDELLKKYKNIKYVNEAFACVILVKLVYRISHIDLFYFQMNKNYKDELVFLKSFYHI